MKTQKSEWTNKKEKKGNYWMVNTRGMVSNSPRVGRKFAGRKSFGNVFKTKQQAMVACKRMKLLFKRIKK